MYVPSGKLVVVNVIVPSEPSQVVGLVDAFIASTGSGGLVINTSTSSNEVQLLLVTDILLYVPANNPEIVPTFPTTTIVAV